jgi:hypothetical protein
MPAVSNPPNMLQEAATFVNSIPTITRYISLSTVLFSLAAQVALIDVRQILLSFPQVLEKGQVWRLFTNHLYSEGMGLIWYIRLI